MQVVTGEPPVALEGELAPQLSVVAYAAFMTREYPPFRLDTGPHEPSIDIAQERPS